MEATTIALHSMFDGDCASQGLMSGMSLHGPSRPPQLPNAARGIRRPIRVPSPFSRRVSSFSVQQTECGSGGTSYDVRAVTALQKAALQSSLCCAFW